MLVLEKIKIKNFKSFKEFNLDKIMKLTVLIGSNGSGKSNFLSIIDVISHIFHNTLQKYLLSKGIAFKDCIYQWDIQNEINLEMTFSHEGQINYKYTFSLRGNEDNSFVVCNESLHNLITDKLKSYQNNNVDYLAIKKHSKDSAEEKLICEFLQKVQGYSFYNTNFFTNRISSANKEDTKFLKGHGDNIAAVVYYLKQAHYIEYLKIVASIQMIIKGFHDFHFELEGQDINMQCLMGSSSVPTSVRSLSEGTVRFMVLTLLLNLPEGMRSSIILLEEPEIALHPHAISVLGDLIDSYAQDSQIMVATQSPYLLSKLNIESVYVLHMDDNADTLIHNIDKDKLVDWLKHYSLGDLWMMNILGGNPI